MGYLSIAIRRCVTIAMIMVIVIMLGNGKKVEAVTQERYDECNEKCGGYKGEVKETFEGSHVCHYIPFGPEWMPWMSPKCMTECTGDVKPAEDQTKCMCDHCMFYRLSNYKGYCEEPGVKTHISKEECDKVCAGNDKIKYRERFCDPGSEEHYEKFKKAMM